MIETIKQIFTWWNRQTIGTRWYTWRKGKWVGKDQFGNQYYQNQQKNRRWVIYNGEAEASNIPPGWYGWLHHKIIAPPSENYVPKEWEQKHQPNLTGTPNAWKPPGSLRIPARKRKIWRHYTPWKPLNGK